jgi:hypothetical protein
MGLLSSMCGIGGVGSLVGGGAMAGAGVVGLIIAPIVAAFATGAVDFQATLHTITTAAAPLAHSLLNLGTAVVPLLAAIGGPLIQAVTGLAAILAPLITGMVDLTTAVVNGAASFVSGFGDFMASLAPASERHTDAEEQERDRIARLNAPMPTVDLATAMNMTVETAMSGTTLALDRGFQEWMPGIVDTRFQGAAVLADMMHAPASNAPRPLHAPAAPDARGGAHTVNDFRHSRFEIMQKFSEGFDPDRIAIAFTHDLERTADQRLSGQFEPAHAVR